MTQAKTEKVIVCLACGKMSHDRFGSEPISHGWDESCVLNCREFDKSRLVMSEDGLYVVDIGPEPEASPHPHG